MKRTKVKPKKDRKIFRNTAQKTKAINLTNKVVPRGGIRL